MSPRVRRTRDIALGELQDVASRRTSAQNEADELYVRQVELYVELREFDPPVLLREIAAAAGAKVVAVDAAITKHLTRRAAS